MGERDPDWLAGGSWLRLAVAIWRLVAVGGGWQRLAVSGWWQLAVGGWRSPGGLWGDNWVPSNC